MDVVGWEKKVDDTCVRALYTVPDAAKNRNEGFRRKGQASIPRLGYPLASHPLGPQCIVYVLLLLVAAMATGAEMPLRPPT